MEKYVSRWALLGALLLSLAGCVKEATTYCDSLETCGVFADGLLAVKEDDAWGYVNQKNEVVIDFDFDGAGAFINGTAIVEIDGEYQLINKKGESLLDDPVDSLVRDLTQKLLIYELDGDFGLINESGRIIVESAFDGCSGLFGQNLLAVKKGTKWGYANTRGDFKIEPEYDSARMFTKGLAVVKQNDKYGYINDRNSIEIDIEYASAQPFDSYERAIVTTTEDVYQLIDTHGDMILEGVHIKGSGPIYGVKAEDGLYRLFDKEGERFTSDEYTSLWSLGERYANVELDGEDLYQIYDEDGDVIRQEEYDVSDVYVDDSGTTILVKIDALDEVIKVYGYKNVLTFEGSGLAQINKERVIVQRNGRYGAIDYQGNTKVEFYYDQMLLFSNEFYLVEVNDKYGVVDTNGRTVLPMIYEAVNPWDYPV